jgi:hypothetical protein
MEDNWQLYFPPGSLYPRPDLHRGLAEWFALFLERMGEQPLYAAAPHQPLVIRLLCLPTWSGACGVRVETDRITWRLVGEEMDGEAGFEVGKVVGRENRLLSAAEAHEIAETWRWLRFWSLSPWGEHGVFDGTTYVLEAAEHGRYHVAHRVSPEWGDTFGEFLDLLVRLAGFALR